MYKENLLYLIRLEFNTIYNMRQTRSNDGPKYIPGDLEEIACLSKMNRKIFYIFIESFCKE